MLFDHYCAIKARPVPKPSITKTNERLVFLITSPHPPTLFLFQHSPNENEGSVSGYTGAFVSVCPALSVSLCAFVSASLSSLWLTALTCQWWRWNVSANKIKLPPGITPAALFTLYRLCWTLYDCKNNWSAAFIHIIMVIYPIHPFVSVYGLPLHFQWSNGVYFLIHYKSYVQVLMVDKRVFKELHV